MVDAQLKPNQTVCGGYPLKTIVKIYFLPCIFGDRHCLNDFD